MTHSDTSRREFLTSTLLTGATLLAGTGVASGAQSAVQRAENGVFWPGGARLAVSFSLMFEAGGQPISGAGGPVTEPIQNGAPDLPTNSYFLNQKQTPVVQRGPVAETVFRVPVRFNIGIAEQVCATGSSFNRVFRRVTGSK